MKLAKASKEWYALEITTTPAVTSWDASFDGGTNWLPSTTVGTDGYFRWLVAGPDADPTGATALPVGRTLPMLRATENPEVVVLDFRDDVPPIDIA